jgi:hypothetical protein
VSLFQLQLKKCFNVEEIEELRDADDGERAHDYIASGSFPIIDDIKVTYDFKEHIGDKVDPELTGYASFKRLIPNRDPQGRPRLASAKSTEVHYMQFFKPPGATVAVMRYKTSAQSTIWYPAGANGRDNVGIPIFKEGAELPGLSDTPPLADFMKPWKNEEVVKDAILSLHEKHPQYMNAAQGERWIDFFESIPESPQAVALKDRPHTRLKHRPELALRVPSPQRGARAVDRSVLDPPDAPPLPTVTYAAWNPAARRSEANDLLDGALFPFYCFEGFRFVCIAWV